MFIFRYYKKPSLKKLFVYITDTFVQSRSNFNRLRKQLMVVQGRIPYRVKVGGGKAGKAQALPVPTAAAEAPPCSCDDVRSRASNKPKTQMEPILVVRAIEDLPGRASKHRRACGAHRRGSSRRRERPVGRRRTRAAGAEAEAGRSPPEATAATQPRNGGGRGSRRRHTELGGAPRGDGGAPRGGGCVSVCVKSERDKVPKQLSV